MKVLEKGPDTKSGKEFRCRGWGIGPSAGCGALLLVFPSDIQVSHYDGDTDYYFICPECHKHTAVSANTFSNH